MTGHDFSDYKRGTIERRMHRRMSVTGQRESASGYLERLKDNPDEAQALARDLLIHVTRFFRDPAVFEKLAQTALPELLQALPDDRPLRLWVAGCSTGEEAYSLAILLHEAAIALKRPRKLQIFATDLEAESIATAREGLYPQSIEADVSPERLSSCFIKVANGYRILPEIKASIVFSVQDVLLDPPFSRLDMVSCRNLLIYLKPEAQRGVLDVFHFALRTKGVLLLGSAEAVVPVDGRFTPIAKGERIFRKVGSGGALFAAAPRLAASALRTTARLDRGGIPPSRPFALAELCRQVVLQTLAPVSILINARHEALYFLGPTERFFSLHPGFPTTDILLLARDEIRAKLRSVVQQALRTKVRCEIRGVQLDSRAEGESFRIEASPAQLDGEELLVISFVAEPVAPAAADRQEPSEGVAALEAELTETRSELQAVIRDLEAAGEDQKAINEEALSINEEYQSANEELVTSKEELQALNEELTALNTQLQETLEQQRVFE